MSGFRLRKSSDNPPSEQMETWLNHPQEGQLSVDVFRDGEELVIRSTVSGVKSEDIDVAIHGDLLTVRGKREAHHAVNEDDWFYRECYWGSFSRSIILPVDVYPERAQASITNGVLELRLPIRTTKSHIDIKMRDS